MWRTPRCRTMSRICCGSWPVQSTSCCLGSTSLGLAEVAICKYWTWLPSLFISVSFFGIVHIASHMENPFGSDDDDIPVWDIAEHLDEEVSLIMFYAALDEVGGENLYRGLAAQDHIYVK
mmetsp:Transcript_140882/g.450422  ORF Transcript_140882/g.450422 Transcript_140882/m.450422 type:complete len:120 (-) Transcript_140882:82-441(-)